MSKELRIAIPAAILGLASVGCKSNFESFKPHDYVAPTGVARLKPVETEHVIDSALFRNGGYSPFGGKPTPEVAVLPDADSIARITPQLNPARLPDFDPQKKEIVLSISAGASVGVFFTATSIDVTNKRVIITAPMYPIEGFYQSTKPLQVIFVTDNPNLHEPDGSLKPIQLNTFTESGSFNLFANVNSVSSRSPSAYEPPSIKVTKATQTPTPTPTSVPFVK